MLILKAPSIKLTGCRLQMLSKCANPICPVPFRYLHEGKIFNVPVYEVFDEGRPSRVEHFWLCNSCAATLTVFLQNGIPVVRLRFSQLTNGQAVREEITAVESRPNAA